MVGEKDADRRHRAEVEQQNADTTNEDCNCNDGRESSATEEQPTPASTTVAGTSGSEAAGHATAGTPSSSSSSSANRAVADEETTVGMESDDVVVDGDDNNNRRTSIGSNTWMAGLQTLAASAGIGSAGMGSTTSSSAGGTGSTSTYVAADRPPDGLGRQAHIHPAMLSPATSTSASVAQQRTNDQGDTAADSERGPSITTLERVPTPGGAATFSQSDSIFDASTEGGDVSTISSILIGGESVAHRATACSTRRWHNNSGHADAPSISSAEISTLTDDRYMSAIEATGTMPLRPEAESGPAAAYAPRLPPSFRSQPGAYHVRGIDSAAPGLTTLRRSITDEGDYIDEDEIDMVGAHHPATMMTSGGGTERSSSGGAEATTAPGIDVDFVTEAVAVDDDVPVAARVVEDVALHVEDCWNEDGSTQDSTADSTADGNTNNCGSKDSKRRRWVVSSGIMLILVAVVLAVIVAILVGGNGSAGEDAGMDAIISNTSTSDVAQGSGAADGIDLGFFETPPACRTTGYLPKCGQCWCAPSTAEDDGSYACPDLPEGIINECTGPNRRASLAAFYRSFELASVPDYLGESPIMHLGNFALPNISEQNRENSPQPCDPYAGILEGTTPADDPHLGLPPCYPQGSQWPYSSREEDMVCAYKFLDPVSDVESCKGRIYDLVSYDSEEEAIADGALVTHGGPCGFCSNAHDLASFIENDIGQTDASRYFQCRMGGETDFAQCFIGDLKLTADCGTWFLALQNPVFNACRDQCVEEKMGLVGSGKSLWDIQGPPPACEPSGCLKCVREYTKIAAALAGRETRQQPGGIFSPSRYYECSAFEYPKVAFDPCDGLV